MRLGGPIAGPRIGGPSRVERAGLRPLALGAALLACACARQAPPGEAALGPAPPGEGGLGLAPPADAGLLDLDAPALERELASGRLTAERLTRAALARIAALDGAGPALHAIIEINPDAVAIARELDRRFAEQGPVGPLHGLPVVLKANIDTADRMATTAGSLALAGHHAAADADVAARLRRAGAVIIGKANLSEWANFRSTRSTSGWSSLGGQTRNPYVLDRTPCGSSSGSAVAVAARLVPLAVGTETDGSIVCPAGMNGVVGIKPTHGLVSARGIIPISASQDTAGPLARTVAGAAMLLRAIETDETGSIAPGAIETDDTGLLAPGARTDLRGLRLGVVRAYAGAGETPAAAQAAFARSLDALAAAGAKLVDPVELDLPAGFRAAELEVLLYEFKTGIDRYLADERTEPGSLAGLIAFDREHAGRVMPYFGQELFLEAEARGGLDEPAYRRALADSRDALRARLERVFADERLDALVAPVNEPAPKIDLGHGDRIAVSSSSIAAVSGYPSVAVPAGLVGGLPVAIAFVGKPHDEASLVGIAAVFELRRGPLPAPRFLPRLD